MDGMLALSALTGNPSSGGHAHLQMSWCWSEREGLVV